MIEEKLIADDITRIKDLYFEVAKELYEKAKLLMEKFDEMTEEEIEELSNEEYSNYSPYGFNKDSYWLAVDDYLRDFEREIERVLKYNKVEIKLYQISVIIDHNSSVHDLDYDKTIYTVQEGVEAIEKLLSIKTKEELMKYRPLLLFGDKFSTKFLFPPLRLGCRARTVII